MNNYRTSCLMCHCRNAPVQQSTGLADQITLSLLVTIGLFILGFIFNYWRTRHNELKRLQNLRLYFYVALENFLAAVDNQRKYFRDFSLTLKSKKTASFYILKSSAGFNLNNLFFLSRDDIFKALATEQSGNLKEKSKAFAVLYDQMELLDSISKSQKNEVTEFVDNLNKYQFEFDQSIDKIDKLFKVTLLKHIEKDGAQSPPDPLLSRIDKIIADWQQHSDYRNIYVKKEMIIDKLREIVKEKKISEFRHELEKVVMSGVLSFHNYEANLDRFTHIYRAHTLSLARAKAKIINQLVFFNSLIPRKVLWFLPLETMELLHYKKEWKEYQVEQKGLNSNEI
jgi:hypothetical protein